MKAHDDPALEIRRALDREVERSFDATRLATALDSRLPRANVPARSGGPLSRVPAPVQWIGIAAAIVAAVTGVRSLYVELTTPRSVEERPVSALPSPPAPESKIEPRTLPPPAPRPRQEVRVEPAPVVATERARPAAPPEAAPKEPEPVASTQERFASPQVARTVPPPAPTTARVEAPRSALPSPSPAPLAVVATTAVATRPGVEVRSVEWSGRKLEPKVEEVPEIGATLIQVDGRQTEPRPSPESSRGAKRAEEQAAGDSVQPVEAYYVRVLHGSAHPQASAAEHGIVTENLSVVPLGETWGSEQHQDYLRGAFALASVVAQDGVRLEGPFGQGNLLAATGGNVYAVAISVMPDESDERNTVELSISRTGSSRKLEAVIAIGDEEVAVLAVPDHPLARSDRAVDMTFVVVSPRLDDPSRSGAAGRQFVERPDEPPIPIEGDAPRDGGAWGPRWAKVQVRAVVRIDGSVGGVEILELPDVPGAEQWIETVSARIRGWRYRPARHRGRVVAAYVTIDLEVEEPGSTGRARDGDR